MDVGFPFQFESAGFGSAWGPADARTIRILRQEEGIDLRDFQSKNLSLRLVQASDFVLTMEWAHRDLLRMSYSHLPGIATKVFALKELAGEEENEEEDEGRDAHGSIRDPYDEPEARYRAILHEIKSHVRRAIDHIVTIVLARRRAGRLDRGTSPQTYKTP